MALEIDYAQKTQEWLSARGRGTVIATVAAKGHKRHGRGHVMVICKASKSARKNVVPKFQYITEHENRNLGRRDPRAADPDLDRMVREYDPTREAVVVAFWGSQYLLLKVGIEPEPTMVDGGEQ